METVREFTYLGDRVSTGGGCEAAVTARRQVECTIQSEQTALLEHVNNIRLTELLLNAIWHDGYIIIMMMMMLRIITNNAVFSRDVNIAVELLHSDWLIDMWGHVIN